MLIKVKNISGTTDNEPPFGYSTWKDYWKHIKGYWPTKCSVLGCGKQAEVGAHVRKVDSFDNDWYIIPMCRDHNSMKDAIFYVDDSMLVKANCRKQF